MRALVMLLVLLPGVAVADDAQRDLMVEYTRIARSAAQGGHCDVVRDLGERVRAIDATYYTASYLSDEAIAKCLGPPPPPVDPQPAPTDPAPLAPPASAPPTEPAVMTEPTPPLEGGRLVGEFLLGGLSSFVGMAGGALAGAVICLDDDNGDFDCLASVLIGAYAGGSIMFSVGVYGAGNFGGQTGSLGMTIVGGLLGAGLGLAAALAIEGEGNNETLIAAALIAGPAIGSMVGFNSTRRWRTPGPAKPTTTPRRTNGPWGSLINFDRGRPSVGVPTVVHRTVRGTPTTSLSLLSGSF